MKQQQYDINLGLGFFSESSSKIVKTTKIFEPQKNAARPKKVLIKGESLVVKDDILQ